MSLGLGWFLFGWARSARMDYWLRTDGQQGMAIIIKEDWGGHGKMVYRYRVNEREYVGISSRDYQDPRYRNVQPGEEASVYFSASHPWLSLLYKPRSFLVGWPALFIVVPLEILALITLVKPTSPWAFNVGDTKERGVA